MSKVISRLRRAAKTRIKAAGQEKPRLSVYKSNSNLYAQILEPRGSKVLVAASTNEKENKLDKSNVDGMVKDMIDEIIIQLDLA